MKPLAELHLHLEGAIEPETLAEIDPAVDAEEARTRYRYANFREFIEAYKWTVLRLTEPRHFALAARRLRERLLGHGVTYAEINVSVGVMLWRKQDARAIVHAIREELHGWPMIFDAVRQFGGDAAIPVAELANEFEAAFGIGGEESAYPIAEFRPAIAIARNWFVPHAGETSNARNVWEAVDAGARRIGHGIRAIEDPVLCRRLRDQRIPLEISVSSNVATGAVASIEAHPVRRLFDLGVPLTINTDDPAMFHCSLAGEFAILRRLGFAEGEIEQLRQNAFQFAMAR
jgi:aminodeoxyfutalosine deaminase